MLFMPKLRLSFQGEDRTPIHLDDDVPVRGMAYTIADHEDQETDYIVSLVRKRLWPRNKYVADAKGTEFIAGTEYEVMLVTAADIASGKVKLRFE